MASKPSPAILKLRAEAALAKKAVNAKIYRIRTKQHIEIRGTKDDPTKPVSTVNKMNGPQLRAYIQRLKQFSSRDTQFYSGAKGSIIPKKLFLEFKRLESVRNAIADARYAERANIVMPGVGNTMTIGEAEKDMLADRKRAIGNETIGPYQKKTYEAANINGEQGLKDLITSLNKQLSANYLDETLTRQRDQLDAMLESIGDTVTIDKVKDLTKHQFDILFNAPGFAGVVAGIYDIFKKMAAGAKESWYNQMAEQGISEINEAIVWALSLPEESKIDIRTYTGPMSKKAARTKATYERGIQGMKDENAKKEAIKAKRAATRAANLAKMTPAQIQKKKDIANAKRRATYAAKKKKKEGG